MNEMGHGGGQGDATQGLRPLTVLTGSLGTGSLGTSSEGEEAEGGESRGGMSMTQWRGGWGAQWRRSGCAGRSSIPDVGGVERLERSEVTVMWRAMGGAAGDAPGAQQA